MRVGLVTLGCDKNTVDNEYLAGLLEQAGCELVVLGNQARNLALDAVVVTTCGFIGSAKEQSVQAIVQLAERKRRFGQPQRIYVAGCLGQRYADQLLAEIPEIDGLVGVGQFKRLADLILHDGAPGIRKKLRQIPRVDIDRHLRRRRLDNRPYAFLKISDGCNHACSFCSIPRMKGKLRSVPPEILLAEAQELLDQGVKEINLVAQDLSTYGMDRWKDYGLDALLRDLCALAGDFWIRCLYYYPGHLTDAFLERMAGQSKIVPYLDLPLQYLDPGVLRQMKRPFHEDNIFDLVQRLRRGVPGLTLRTTMMVGFPGETPAAHRNMLEGMAELRFDRLGVFEYSLEEDTPAAGMPNQVGAAVRKKRWRAVMAAQAAISRQLNRQRIGRKTRVLIEGLDLHEKMWVGRSPAEAPEIDGKVFIESPAPLKPGEFIGVEIIRAETYDVYGRPLRKI